MEEKYNIREKRTGIIFLLLSVLWMAVIFMFSAQTGDESGRQSGFIADIVRKLIPFELSLSEIDTLTFIIRKLAHFTEYAVLGVLYFETVYSFRRQSIKGAENVYEVKRKLCCITVLLTAVLCMLYAVSDEFHQFFTDGRSPTVKDVIIDTCGGFAGSMLVMLIVCIKEKKKK